MSMKATALAMDYGPRIRSYKLLLLALADRADENGICWPSREDLRKRACMSDATITRALRWLESEGWLQRQKRFNSSNIFRLNIWRLIEAEETANASKKRSVPEGFTEFEEEKAHKAKASAEAKATAEAKASKKAPKAQAEAVAPVTYRDPQEFRAFLATAKQGQTFAEWREQNPSQ